MLSYETQIRVQDNSEGPFLLQALPGPQAGWAEVSAMTIEQLNFLCPYCLQVLNPGTARDKTPASQETQIVLGSAGDTHCMSCWWE